MSDDDPFAEPNDTERTVIKPNPMGRRNLGAPQAPPAEPMVAPSGQQAPPPQAEAPPVAPRAPRSAEATVAQSATGLNRLNACASTLFSLISRIRNRAQHMDPDKLRQKVVGEVRAFENRALQANIEPQKVKVARYAICATLDDVVLNTPWGGESSWVMQSMVGTFHREVVGGDRFFDLLARLEQDPSNNIELLEFVYMCLSLGFEGRLRVEQGGSEKHLQIRNGLARIIRAQRGPVERDLSPKWKGVDAPHKPRSIWKPVWISIASLAGVLGLGFFGLSWAISGQTERALGMISALDTGIPPELERKAPPPEPTITVPKIPEPKGETQIEVISKFLDQEIQDGLVTVSESANTISISLAGGNMFPSGSDRVKASFIAGIERVTEALNDQPGTIIVAGHSDSDPIRTQKFPSNTHLSLARAQSVMRIIVSKINDPSRLSAEGRADKEPIADNSTREGKAKNRRIEIILVKAASQ